MRPSRSPTRLLALAALLALPSVAHPQSAGTDTTRTPPPPDPFAWLEDVEGARAMAWVREHNAATIRAFTGDPRYDTLYDAALRVLDARDRIAEPTIRGERIDNFWQDAAHPRGIWRTTPSDAFLAGAPRWRTLLDLDSLSAAEKVTWAWKGATCLPPAESRCLVELSRGGADAVEVREFDVTAGRFVPGGFFLPEAKQDVAWLDADRLLVASDFGPGSLTTSGYPRVARLWRRGTPLSSAATLLEGKATDVSVDVAAWQTEDGQLGRVLDSPSFFDATQFVLRGDTLARLELPTDADVLLVAGQLVVYLRSPWQVGGRSFTAGSLVAAPLDAFLAGSRELRLVLQPGPRQTVEDTRATRHFLLVALLDDVRPRLLRFRLGPAGWRADTIPLPDFGSVTLAATSPATDRFFFSFAGFTQPTTLYAVDPDGHAAEVQRLPARFDAGGLVTEQFQATAPDGTRVPYFVVHRRGLALDGSNPTLMYGYGGFEIALTPDYSPVLGVAWLARGGVYVLANIRGGGEFGPAWHRAAMKEHRQRAYDDFIAVARDVIRRGFTSPAHLGIMGGSNGGLLMGVMLTQQPELWHAVVIRNPLLDMFRYSHLLAGASWMAEYGDPDVPADWAYISRYSPYQNLKPGVQYPRPFIATTTRDDRVHPGHARKFAARMEALGDSVDFFENTEGGHGAGVTSAQRAREEALIYTYLWERLRE